MAMQSTRRWRRAGKSAWIPPLRESRYHPHQQAPFGPPGASAGRNQPYYPDFRTRLVVTLSWLADGRECQLIAAEEYLAESFTLLE